MSDAKRLNILFTNNALVSRGGSELVVLDLAKEFRRRGHFPVAFSQRIGPVAAQFKESCIPVVSDLAMLGNAPDIIHGQHHLESMIAMLHFHATPAVYVCHGWFPWEEMPPKFSNIKQYVAVGDLTRTHVSNTCSVPREDIKIIPNFVDLEKFRMKAAVNPKPLKAAIFGNGFTPQHDFVRIVAQGCRESGIKTLDFYGLSAGNPIVNPETVLAGHDIVFAVGRCAIEAMSLGCAVIISSEQGVGEMVMAENVQAMFGKFGASSLRAERMTVEFLKAEIAKYHPKSVQRVSEWIRSKVDLRLAADQYEQVYHEALQQQRDTQEPASQDRLFRETARYISALSVMIKEDKNLIRRLHGAVNELSRRNAG